jgi:uncharacterized membrane protein
LDDIDITEPSVSATTNHGTTVLTTPFTVWSTDADLPSHNPDAYDGPGNTTLYGITFSSQDLRAGNLIIPAANVEFLPSTIDSLQPGHSHSVQAKVNVPYGTYATIYSGLATAINNTGTTSDTVRIFVTVLPSYDIDISDNTGNLIQNWMTLTVTPLPNVAYDSAYFVTVNPNSPDLNVDPDMFGNFDLSNIYWTVNDLIHLTDPIAYIPKESVKVFMTTPHFIASGATENFEVKVSVPVFQLAGDYNTWLKVYDSVAGVADSFQLKVVVLPIEDIDIIENQITQTVNTGDILVYIGQYTVVNPDAAYNPDPDWPSNIDLDNLRFTCENLREIGTQARYIPAQNIFVELVGSGSGPLPVDNAYIAELALGMSQDVKVWALVPRGTYATTYRGEMQVLDDDGYPSDRIAVQITVNPYYDLDISDNEQSLYGNKMRLAAPMNDSTQVGYFRVINPNTAALNVDEDIFGNDDFDSVKVTISNLVYIPVPGTDISYTIPSSRVNVALIPALISGQSFDARVKVYVPSDVFAGTYRATVTVTGYPTSPGTTTDMFTLEVVVGAVDDIDIREASVSATTNHGTSVNTSTFRVYSTDAAHNPDSDGPGNTTLYGITFTAQDLRNGMLVIPSANIEFVPIAIDSIKPGDSVFVYARVNVPYGTFTTTYSGIATATNNTGTTSDTVRIIITVNPYYDLDIADNEQNLTSNKLHLSGPMGSIRQGTFRMINPNNPDLNVDPDQFGNADFASFTSSVDNLTYIPFGQEEINYVIPSSAVILTLPLSGIASGNYFDATVTVNIPMNTFAGVYRGKVRVTGSPTTSTSTPTDSFVLEVVIGPLDDIDITEPSVSGSGNHGTTVNTGNFTVWSTDADSLSHNPDTYDGPGNTTLYGITLSSQDLQFGNFVIPGSGVSFVPITIESLPPGQSRTVQAQVTVPYGVHNGIYSGLATATNNTGTTSDTVRIIVTVNASYDLDIADNAQSLVGNKMTLVGNMNSMSDSAFFLLVNPNSPDLNVDPDQFGNANFDSLKYTRTVLQYIPAGQTDIVYTIPAESVKVSVPNNLASGASAIGKVKVSIPPDRCAGTYRGKVWVTGYPMSNTHTDTFTLEVIVRPVEDLDIDLASVSDSGVHGTTAITNSFKVYSTDGMSGNNPDPDGPGNTTLYGINFITTDLRFGERVIPFTNIEVIPTNIDSLKPGQFKACSVKVNIPYGTHDGLYTGLVTAQNNTGSTSDTVRVRITVTAMFDLDIADNQQNLVSNKMNLAGPMGATRQGFFRMVNPNTPELNIDPDMYGNADFTSFTYVVDTLKFIAGGDEDILTYIPPSAVTLTLPTEPTGLVSGGSYDARTQVLIPANTLTGTYRGNVTVTGAPSTPGSTPTDVFVLEVQVGLLEDLDIEEAFVLSGGLQGNIVTTTPFKVWSTDSLHNPDPDPAGNITLYGINFIAQDLRLGEHLIPAVNIQFVPATIVSLYPGTSQQVRANVTIPYGTYTGTYSGLVTAQNNTGSTSDTVRIYVAVEAEYDLDIADNLAGLVSNKMSLSLVPNYTATSQFLLVNPDRPENNYDPDPYGNANLTGLQYKVSPILYSPGNYYELSGDSIRFSNNPTDLAWGAGVNVSVTATIDPLQPYATYYGTVTVYKIIGEIDSIADSFTLEVVVGPRDIFMMPDTIWIYGNAGTFADTSFFIRNTGNKTIDRIELFMMTDFFTNLNARNSVRIPMSNLEFTPPIIVDSIRIGESTEVIARVNIPRATLPTTYYATAKAMQQSGDPAKNFVIVLNVNYQDSIDQGIIPSDNPVTGSYVDIAVIGDPGDHTLTIMNMAAEIVISTTVNIPKYATSALSANPPSSTIYHWTLVNNSGKGVASGLYVAILQTKINKIDKVFTKKLLIVK